MPCGSISSSNDCVGVAVVNYRVPVPETKQEVLENCHKISKCMDGVKTGYPGVDLICFPEYSTQGFHPTKWRDLTTTLDGPEVQVFREACIRNQVYGIFSITGEQHPDASKNPYNTLIMITDKGDINLVYRKIFPWCPKEPWTAGHETAVAVGPKGIVVGGLICYDGNMPEAMRDTVMKGAELVVRIQGYMYPAKEQQRIVTQVRSWENLCYSAVANMAGRDHVYTYFGHSCIVGFDGSVTAECGTCPDEVTYATLSLTAIRDARRNWTSENHLYNIMHRGMTSEPGGRAECCFSFYKDWVSSPASAKQTSEQLTRETDDPSHSQLPTPQPPPASKLAQQWLQA
ncbi:carbon-nitrogen hydrolase [Dunaliella salina]|uniref:Carbon-nitrogen hydrolase n=1 Tax=Dunaliella salina TaxID=3046 RepID=A0ABQ7GPU1_DUNSA|nr:carbon-nitrogen hydrolase [Dunaliella salina]|eukprot:KAF5836623.1 carbon-nitrogen hydrolase [Dunaliella salina]